MKIVIKENDRLKSSLHKNRMVSEYLIYLMNGETPIECYTEIGLSAKNDRVNELLLTNFASNNKMDLTEILTEVSFEEFRTNK